MNEKWKADVDFLYEAVLQLHTKEECASFFADLCTVTELKAMAQRLAVAKLLCEKKVYSEIAAETGASTATISRVNRSLLYGNDGYTHIFDRLKNEL